MLPTFWASEKSWDIYVSLFQSECDICSICLESLNPFRRLVEKKKDCSHYFHRSCLVEFVKKDFEKYVSRMRTDSIIEFLENFSFGKNMLVEIYLECPMCRDLYPLDL